MATKVWSPVEFKCPDVRHRQELDTIRCPPADKNYWLHVHPGVSYRGCCENRACISRQTSASVLCSMGFGKHRPNEDYCYDEILCPACKHPFQPEQFIFSNCSAKINFCIKGSAPDRVSISEDRPSKCRAFGKYGQKVVYTMLVIEVDDPGVHPDMDELESFTNSLGSTTVGTPTTRQSLGVSSSSSALDLDELFRNLSLERGRQLKPSMLDPSQIRYCQDSISNRFQCGRRIRETRDKLVHGIESVDDIPTIRVFPWNGEWYTEDNRRLWAFKGANLRSVPVKMIEFSRVRREKLTTTNNGRSIRVRGL